MYQIIRLAIALSIWAKQYNNIFLENFRCLISKEKNKIRITTHININNEVFDIWSFSKNTQNKTVSTFHKFSNGINADIVSCLTTYILNFIFNKNNMNVLNINK